MLIQVKVAKVNSVLDFEVEQLPKESLVYVLTYGLTQALGDAHASIARKNFDSDKAFLEAVNEKVWKREAQIRSGDVPGSRGPADPNAAAARKLAKELGSEGIDLATLSPEEKAAMVAAVTKARAKAQRAIENRPSA